nr:MAG TPA: hypothetical protein [Caudoviricetes sp.]
MRWVKKKPGSARAIYSELKRKNPLEAGWMEYYYCGDFHPAND